MMEWYRRFYKWQKNWRHMRRERTERIKLLKYLEDADIQGRDQLRLYFKTHCFNTFPYFWADDEIYSDDDVLFDNQYGLYYVYWNGKKLYYKKGVKKRIVKQNINSLKLEQYKGSPHRYSMEFDAKYIADLGAAEGCFALEVIEQVEHVFLFECDPVWLEPLEATFAPWRDKVTIETKFIGRQSDELHTTLDEYFYDKPLDFIKADIEGAEVEMLIGGEKTLREKVQGVNVCLYHRPSDESDILSILHSYGYRCFVNPGYMLMMENKNDPSTWLRHALVQAIRINPAQENN